MTRYFTLFAAAIVLVGTGLAQAATVGQAISSVGGGNNNVIILQDDLVSFVADGEEGGDQNVEFRIDQVGDILYGYFSIPQLKQTAQGGSLSIVDAVEVPVDPRADLDGDDFNTLTGLFAVKAESFDGDTINYVALSEEDNFQFADGTFWNSVRTMAGTMISLFEDPVDNYTDVDEASGVASVIDGTLIGELGMTGEGDEHFRNIITGGLIDPTGIGFQVSLNFLDGFVVNVIENDLGTEFYAQELEFALPNDLGVSRGDVNAAIVIPAPAALPAGLAMLGLAATRRRRRAA